jgi:hypothetical protein
MSVRFEPTLRHTVKMVEPTDPTPFERELLARFPVSHTTSGGEVCIGYEDAVAAVELAQERGLRILGMEDFVVGESVYLSMSRITDVSELDSPEDVYDHAKTLLNGPWAAVPDDLHAEAEGAYMIDLVAGD